MKVVTRLCFLIFSLSIFAGSCKLDPVIYPDGTALTGNFIRYTLRGKEIIVKNQIGFVVIPTSPGVPDGNLQIFGGSTAADVFSFSCGTSTTGTFKIDFIEIGTLIGDGEVTITDLQVTDDRLSGHLTGTFTATLFDPDTDTNVPVVNGAFDIKL